MSVCSSNAATGVDTQHLSWG